jgi:hypothetical protein
MAEDQPVFGGFFQFFLIFELSQLAWAQWGRNFKRVVIYLAIVRNSGGVNKDETRESFFDYFVDQFEEKARLKLFQLVVQLLGAFSAQCHKTFFVCNLGIFVISLSVFPDKTSLLFAGKTRVY